MKFQVSRTSQFDSDVPPCEGATREMVPNYDVRTFKTFKEYDDRLAAFDGSWLSRGTEHKVLENSISRRLHDVEVWTVTLTSLEQLMDFVGKYGTCVLGEGDIEIYDDYRE